MVGQDGQCFNVEGFIEETGHRGCCPLIYASAPSFAFFSDRLFRRARDWLNDESHYFPQRGTAVNSVKFDRHTSSKLWERSEGITVHPALVFLPLRCEAQVEDVGLAHGRRLRGGLRPNPARGCDSWARGPSLICAASSHH